MKNKEAEELIIKARSYAIKRLPYMSHLLYFLRPIESKNIPTAGVTQYGSMYYNPDFLLQFSTNEVAFILIHEAFHILQDSHGRRQNRKPKKWNIASDIAINDLMENCGFSIDWEGLCLARKFKLPLLKSAEYYYNNLNDIPEDSFFDIIQNDDENDPSGRKIEDVEIARRVNANEIKKYSKYGNIPDSLIRSIEDLFAKKEVGWETVFRQNEVRVRNQIISGKKDYSYRKLSRRDYEVIIPGLIDYEITLGILVDTSGSMSDESLQKGLSQIKYVINKFNTVWLVSIDTETHTLVRIKFGNDLFKTGNIKGGGGTILTNGFKDLEKVNVDMCIAISDCCAEFGDKPKFPVIWLCEKDNHDNPPWGDVVEIR